MHKVELKILIDGEPVMETAVDVEFEMKTAEAVLGTCAAFMGMARKDIVDAGTGAEGFETLIEAAERVVDKPTKRSNSELLYDASVSVEKLFCIDMLTIDSVRELAETITDDWDMIEAFHKALEGVGMGYVVENVEEHGDSFKDALEAAICDGEGRGFIAKALRDIPTKIQFDDDGEFKSATLGGAYKIIVGHGETIDALTKNLVEQSEAIFNRAVEEARNKEAT